MKTLTIVIEFKVEAMSPQREREVQRLVKDLSDDVEAYAGKVTKAELR